MSPRENLKSSLLDELCAQPRELLYIICEYARPARKHQNELFRPRTDRSTIVIDLLWDDEDKDDVGAFASYCARMHLGPDDFDRPDVEGVYPFYIAVVGPSLPLIEYMYRERLKRFPVWFTVSPTEVPYNAPCPNLLYSDPPILQYMLSTCGEYEALFATVSFILQEASDLINLHDTSFSVCERSPLMEFLQNLKSNEGYEDVFAKRLLVLLLQSGANFSSDERTQLYLASTEDRLAIEEFLLDATSITMSQSETLVFPPVFSSAPLCLGRGRGDRCR